MVHEILYIDVREFVDFGYLQEVNRRFFHPLGLALEVNVGDDGEATLGRVWDYRDDREGIYFAEGPDGEPAIDYDKYARVAVEEGRREIVRRAALGYFIQPPS